MGYETVKDHSETPGLASSPIKKRAVVATAL
jgi:hypothetical protein